MKMPAISYPTSLLGLSYSSNWHEPVGKSKNSPVLTHRKPDSVGKVLKILQLIFKSLSGVVWRKVEKADEPSSILEDFETVITLPEVRLFNRVFSLGWPTRAGSSPLENGSELMATWDVVGAKSWPHMPSNSRWSYKMRKIFKIRVSETINAV